MKRIQKLFVHACTVAVITASIGCESVSRREDMVFQRGAQILAAGSPEAAIPLLSQATAGRPDGPEPHAILAMAFALDLQPDRAVRQAAEVRRKQGSAPGWEAVAMGIASLLRHDPETGIAHLQQAASTGQEDPAVRLSARQWLMLAHVLAGDMDRAVEVANDLRTNSRSRISATMWLVPIHAARGQTEQVQQTLRALAEDLSPVRSPEVEAATADRNDFDFALASIGAGHSEEARNLIQTLKAKDASSDALLWLAMLHAESGWDDFQKHLRVAMQHGSDHSRGMAMQMGAVVAAINQEPRRVVQQLVSGQRMLGRGWEPPRVVKQPEHDDVWFSDKMQ